MGGKRRVFGMLAALVALAAGCGTAAPATSNGSVVPDAGSSVPTQGTHCGDGLVLCADGLTCATSVNACPTPDHCAAGDTLCPPTATFAAYCADLVHDALNCGICGRVCPSTQACVGGTCQIR